MSRMFSFMKEQRGDAVDTLVFFAVGIVFTAMITSLYVHGGGVEYINNMEYKLKIGTVTDTRISIDRSSTLIQFIFEDNSTLTLKDWDDVLGEGINYNHEYVILYTIHETPTFVKYWRLD